jgi:hypothetical protein
MNGARRPRFRALQRDHIGSVDPHALKIPARRAEYSLAESALSPFHAEPTQFVKRTTVQKNRVRTIFEINATAFHSGGLGISERNMLGARM